MFVQHVGVPRRPLLEGEPDLPLLLAAVMTANKWEQDDLAAAVGVDQGTVSKWIRAISAPQRANWQRIADTAGLDVSDIGAVIARTGFLKKKTRRELERENAELRRRLGEPEG
jgi:transcriptional regulator with XRE-family HTH domain